MLQVDPDVRLASGGLARMDAPYLAEMLAAITVGEVNAIDHTAPKSLL